MPDYTANGNFEEDGYIHGWVYTVINDVTLVRAWVNTHTVKDAFGGEGFPAMSGGYTVGFTKEDWLKMVDDGPAAMASVWEQLRKGHRIASNHE